MGSWAASCVISHLPIYGGNECVLITMEKDALSWFESTGFQNIAYEACNLYYRDLHVKVSRKDYSPERLALWSEVENEYFKAHFGTYNDYGTLNEVDWSPVAKIPHIFVKKEIWDFIQEAHPRLMKKWHFSWKHMEERGLVERDPLHVFFNFVNQQRMEVCFDPMQLTGFQYGESPEWQIREEYLDLTKKLNQELKQEYCNREEPEE